MVAAPRPLHEADRLNALRAYDLLADMNQQSLDDIVTVAGEVCGTPIAAVTLIEEHRQHFLARRGIEATETPRDHAFCGYTILDSQPLIVNDASHDERFADNPLVTGNPHIRFYAGAPLITAEGHGLGALCVIDDRPRKLTQSQLTVLEALARQVVTLFEMKRVMSQLADALSRVRTLSQLLPVCAWCRKVRNDQDYWMSVESYLQAQTGSMVTHGICPDCAETRFNET